MNRSNNVRQNNLPTGDEIAREEVFRYLDALPQEARDLINYLPFQACPRQLYLSLQAGITKEQLRTELAEIGLNLDEILSEARKAREPPKSAQTSRKKSIGQYRKTHRAR